MGKWVHKVNSCNACHSLDGSEGVATSYLALFGTIVQFADGTAGVRDEAYLRRAILDPAAQSVKGFAPVMPSYKDVLSEEQVDGVIALIKSLNP